MSKINCNYIKSKIESIARNIINNKKKEENLDYIITNKLKDKEESKQNKLNLSITTLKDSLSCLEEFKDSLFKDKIKKSYYFRNKYNNNYSSICTKGTISSLDNNINSIIDSEKNNNNKNAIYLDDQNEENKITNLLFERINNEQIKEITKIYEQFLYILNEMNYNSNKEEKFKFNILRVLSYRFVKKLFSQNTEYLIKIFYNTIEVNKYFLYQIYLFLSLIYLEEEKINEYLLLSYKTILVYSYRNFENIVKIIDLKNLNNEEINKNITNLNKIIISILKTLTFIPSNSQIIYYITPIKKMIDININDLDIEEKIKNRISEINKLIILLQENKDLNEKLLQIEKLKEINNNIDNFNKKEEEIISKEFEEELKNYDINQKILPEFEVNKYKYSVIIELDETLVHYCEEGDKYFVKVRYGCEIFLQYIHDFCEIIIVSTSGIEYSDIIINNLNSNICLINHKIYTENYHDLNLSLINRDMNKTFFICHQDNFFNAPKSNIIKLKEFDGDEKDKDFVKLHTEFKNIEKKEINDVRNIINNIRNNIMKEIIE